jgi:RNA polymerase sigma factor (sigma-70 family)
MGHKEFTRLYSEHARSVYSFLSYRTGDSVLAEDLLADTFERVLRARRGYDRRKGSERAWLYTIALNCVRDNARRIKSETRALAQVTPSGGHLFMDSAYEGLERRDALREALATLNDNEREAVALRFGADLSLADIAAVLDEPRSKIETRVYRGLKKLRGCLATEF